MTNNPRRRLSEHKAHSRWEPVEMNIIYKCGLKAVAHVVEKSCIAKSFNDGVWLKNIRHRPRMAA